MGQPRRPREDVEALRADALWQERLRSPKRAAEIWRERTPGSPQRFLRALPAEALGTDFFQVLFRDGVWSLYQEGLWENPHFQARERALAGGALLHLFGEWVEGKWADFAPSDSFLLLQRLNGEGAAAPEGVVRLAERVERAIRGNSRRTPALLLFLVQWLSLAPDLLPERQAGWVSLLEEWRSVLLAAFAEGASDPVESLIPFLSHPAVQEETLLFFAGSSYPERNRLLTLERVRRSPKILAHMAYHASPLLLSLIYPLAERDLQVEILHRLAREAPSRAVRLLESHPLPATLSDLERLPLLSSASSRLRLAVIASLSGRPQESPTPAS